MERVRDHTRWTLLLALVVWLLAACGGQPDQAPIRIGSKQFPEQIILGEMYALLLEDAGYPVERKLNMGIGPVLHQALLDDQLDIYPEYTGTALQQILGLPSASDPAQAYGTVDATYKERFNLIWLDPAPMNNPFALAMTQEQADRHGVTAISQLASGPGGLPMIGPVDFDSRPDGLTNPAMQRLNYEASRKNRPPAEVAREFLVAEGLIKGGQ